jgi:hypothetical protein
MGDSLDVINANFNHFDATDIALQTKIDSLSASKANFSTINSSTVNLSYNTSTGTLSANTTSFVATSSSPMVPRAWAIFNGTFASSPFTVANGGILAAYNISSVTRNSQGDYTLNFASGAMNNTNYMVIGYPMDATQNYRPGVLYEGPNNIRTTSQFQVYVFETYNNTLWDSARIQVLIYGGN